MSAGRWLIALGLVVLLAGCASTAPAGPDVTGGVTLRLRMIDTAGGAAALYDIQRNGTLGFGGGSDAQIGRIDWTGMMTAEEIAEVRAVLQKHAWFRPAPTGTGEPRTLSWRLELSGPEGPARFRVTGGCPPLAELRELLDRIARKRFAPILERLPQPGSQG